jgi:hypothetical protein
MDLEGMNAEFNRRKWQKLIRWEGTSLFPTATSIRFHEGQAPGNDNAR